jgi:polyhydroxybutyrate depolymerase
MSRTLRSVAVFACFALAGCGKDERDLDRDGDQPDSGPTAQRCTGLAQLPVDSMRVIASGGRMRTFFVHVPTSHDPETPTPVVLSFHGFNSNATQQQLLARMNDKSDAAGFIAVHPEGTGVPQSWNAGACCGSAMQNDVDDVQFVADLLDDLAAVACVDPERVFSTGMSNGGFLSHRLGCELSDRIAAIAPVAGMNGVAECSPPRAVPVIDFHGTADMIVLYDGGGAGNWLSARATIAGWADHNGCADELAVQFNEGDSRCEHAVECPADGTAILCTVQDGGHTWPGGLPLPVLGKTTTDLSATDAMWDFFVTNPLRD